MAPETATIRFRSVLIRLPHPLLGFGAWARHVPDRVVGRPGFAAPWNTRRHHWNTGHGTFLVSKLFAWLPTDPKGGHRLATPFYHNSLSLAVKSHISDGLSGQANLRPLARRRPTVLKMAQLEPNTRNSANAGLFRGAGPFIFSSDTGQSVTRLYTLSTFFTKRSPESDPVSLSAGPGPTL